MMKPQTTLAIEAPPLGYTVEQAARILGLSRSTVERLAEKGHLEMKQPPGTHKRITERSLRKFLKESSK